MSALKAFVALLGALLMAVVTQLAGDNALSPIEFVNTATWFLGAAVIWVAANLTGSWERYTKFVLAVLLAVLVTVVSAVTDPSGVDWQFEVSTTEWYQIGIGFLAALGVRQAPNTAARG